MTKNEKLINALNQLLSGDIPNMGAGLCYNVQSICLISKKAIREHFETWKHYSGDIDFPVPSINKRNSASVAYLGRENKWTGKYGEMRKDLCRHIIRKLKRGNKRRAK